MKPAFLRDEAFLMAVNCVLKPPGTGLWWLGQSGFLVVHQGRALVLDPYLSDSLTRKYEPTDKPHVRLTERVIAPELLGSLGIIDVITSSHNHTDHFDPETLIPLLESNPQARLVLPAANCEVARQRLGNALTPRLTGLNDGEQVTCGDIVIRGIPAAHNVVDRDADGRCCFLGFVVSWSGLTLYHAGDTLWHEGLVPALRPFAVDLACLPINGNLPERRVAGNLDGHEAAQLAHDIGARLAIPCHFDLFGFNTVAPDEFVSACNRLRQPYRVLQNGEGIRWNRDRMIEPI
jgi:L-ascorbate metabolism protein UlaG (beta-lactamase superfamily)